MTEDTVIEDIVIGGDGLARPAWAATDPLMREYYDTEWGMPVHGEAAMFERLALEGFQAGLSWATVLRKRPAFRREFAGFVPEAVAEFGAADVERLMGCADIIRNRQKIEATISNAAAVIRLREKGGLERFVWSFQPAEGLAPASFEEVPSQSPESRALSAALKKEGFRFVGPTTMFALMEAVGVVDTHLVGSHRRGASGVWVLDEHGRAVLAPKVAPGAPPSDG
ncbi:DNA-3-methyladenine glycosylase I [Falsarthrobacter nasiphocae]|uniref:DNA-3-methyladenine glycosylase I n=1 Tax=Falsarthrobacter nasiphocae TaxID=189863 RepID=A0AAE3YEX4_9MICC|nr:DNA-3-methyladenine glycosylase I [Falsarthrobacter nasiphocae]MDR6892139.1 DNA-3-methyladenine glycosylase I [Falsarthrobacter nasiphocae]